MGVLEYHMLAQKVRGRYTSHLPTTELLLNQGMKYLSLKQLRSMGL